MQTNSFYHMASTVIGVDRSSHEYTEEGVSAEASLGKALEGGIVGREDIEILGIPGRR